MSCALSEWVAVRATGKLEARNVRVIADNMSFIRPHEAGVIFMRAIFLQSVMNY